MSNKALIYTDGGAEPNPGPGAIGVVIQDQQGKTIATISKAVGRVTNNQAEYMAVIAALEKAISLGIDEVEMYADSELIVRQISGRYRVKNAALKPLYQNVIELKDRLKSFSITHIPRNLNKEADRLAGEAVR
ncbi:MAG: ribonuclease HI family protein [Dehalococcoidales bacterium]|nr:MAG: ribonuclease HI family protein [Dehalococcoidales bacterium]